MSELLPCPHCSEQATSYSIWGGNGPMPKAVVSCTVCNASYEIEGNWTWEKPDMEAALAEAIAAWNRRDSLAPAVGSPMEAEPVAWTRAGDLEVLRAHWPMVAVIPASPEQAGDKTIPLYTAPASPDVDLVGAIRIAMDVHDANMLASGADGISAKKREIFEARARTAKQVADRIAALAKVDGREGGK
jgi:hypothetical protein